MQIAFTNTSGKQATGAVLPRLPAAKGRTINSAGSVQTDRGFLVRHSPGTTDSSVTWRWRAASPALCAGLPLAASNRQPRTAPSQAPEVATVAMAPRPVTLPAGLPGRTAPVRVAGIRPQVTGLIRERLLAEDSGGQAGQELHQIAPAPPRAALAEAKAGGSRQGGGGFTGAPVAVPGRCDLDLATGAHDSKIRSPSGQSS